MINQGARQPWRAFLRPFYFTLRKLFASRLSMLEVAYYKTAYYSQFGEDAYLDHVFLGQSSGFYVDIGAFHPFNMSNTCVFYNKGWRGINIEPNPISFRAFPVHRPRDINLNVAVSSEDSEVRFNCSEALSGIVDDTYRHHQARGSRTECRVRTMTLGAILREWLPKRVAIDFMSIDCEGHEAEALRGNDWKAFRPRIVIVEDLEPGVGVIDGIMGSHGYGLRQQLGLSKVFADEHVGARVDG